MQARRTRIIATLGPATATPKMILELARAGMDVARCNFSHGTHEEHAALIAAVRAAERRLDRPIPVLQDLQGPKIRLGAFSGVVTLHEGEEVVFVAGEANTHRWVHGRMLPLPAGAWIRALRARDRMLLGDGEIALTVRAVTKSGVRAVVTSPGVVRAHATLHLPDTPLMLGAITAKDHADLAFGVAQGVEWICVSFVAQAKAIEEARALAQKAARAARTAPPKIMAKIETRGAIDHLDAILDAADGVMIGRGDLGVELPPEQVPMLQKEIIERARWRGKPVVVATEMLASMQDHPRATRAEFSDIATAVTDHADAMMLSGETAIGAHPVAAVESMATVILAAEASRFSTLALPDECAAVNCVPSAIAHMIALLARQGLVHAVALPVALQGGVGLLTMFRPKIPLALAVPDLATARAAVLHVGVVPVIAPGGVATQERALLHAIRRFPEFPKRGGKVALVRSEQGKGLGVAVMGM